MLYNSVQGLPKLVHYMYGIQIITNNKQTLLQFQTSLYHYTNIHFVSFQRAWHIMVLGNKKLTTITFMAVETSP